MNPTRSPLRKPFTRSRRRSALTLPELLVVIAVLVTVMILALPVIQKASTLSKANRCKANLRTLSTALYGYCADHNGRFPQSRHENDVIENADGSTRRTSGPYPWSPRTLQPYTQVDSSIMSKIQRPNSKPPVAGPYYCPAAPWVPADTLSLFTYSYNIFIGYPSNEKYGAATMAGVQRPDKALYVIDHAPNKSKSCFLWEHTWPFPIGSPSEPEPTENVVDFKRHGGNFALGVFLDGHIEKLTFEQLARTKNLYIHPRQ